MHITRAMAPTYLSLKILGCFDFGTKILETWVGWPKTSLKDPLGCFLQNQNKLTFVEY